MFEGTLIEIAHAVKEPLHEVIKPPVLLFFMRLEKAAGEHGGQCQ